MRGGVAISVTATPVAAPRRSMEVLRIINKPSGLRLRLPMGPDRRVPVVPELQIDYGLACIARLEQAPMPERLHYLYLRSFSRKREISEAVSDVIVLPGSGTTFFGASFCKRGIGSEARLAK